MEYNGHAYKLYSTNVAYGEYAYQAAKVGCESLGGYQVEITSEGENNFIEGKNEQTESNLQSSSSSKFKECF